MGIYGCFKGGLRVFDFSKCCKAFMEVMVGLLWVFRGVVVVGKQEIKRRMREKVDKKRKIHGERKG